MAPDILQLLPELGDNVSRLQEHGQVPEDGTGLRTESWQIGSSLAIQTNNGSKGHTKKVGFVVTWQGPWLCSEASPTPPRLLTSG